MRAERKSADCWLSVADKLVEGKRCALSVPCSVLDVGCSKSSAGRRKAESEQQRARQALDGKWQTRKWLADWKPAASCAAAANEELKARRELDKNHKSFERAHFQL